MSQNNFADIIVPLPLAQLFTYSIPSELTHTVKPLVRVTVQFGAKKIYTGIVHSLHNNKPKDYETKSIISVLDESPVITSHQLKLWEWISDYYLCSIGEVFKAALPSGLKLESETLVYPLVPENTYPEDLTSTEQIILDALALKKQLSISQIQNITRKKDIHPAIRSLLEKKLIQVEESLKGGVNQKKASFIIINKNYREEKIYNELMLEAAKAKKQLALLQQYYALSNSLTFTEGVEKSILLEKAKAGPSSVKSLIEKGIFIEEHRTVSRLETYNTPVITASELSSEQHNALSDINEKFKQKDVTLLHGVTSSGKTEIYIQLINQAINDGKQVLYLLPEIALTEQIIIRLKKVFGNTIGVYHSKYSDGEKVEIWNKLLSWESNSADSLSIILGVRSSVFLPFKNLGLVIIDEEHENTYKQYDPAPRYHARDTAIVLASMHKAKTLLGTATPSMETYLNVLSGKYALVELFARFKNIRLPEIQIADIVRSRKKKQLTSYFTKELLDAIEHALANNEQVILFQNRRGYSPYIECDDCGWVPHCKNCDVSLTYHKKFERLTCHYCGYSTKLLTCCEECNSSSLKTKGMGTEKIEDEISMLFPQAKIARMDVDSAQTRKAFLKLINDFETRKTDILVGTQMLSKGLDFENVGLVGVINADNLLNFPDFRSFERAYQLLTQVSGRAGRNKKQGKVIIQTSSPNNYVIKLVKENDINNIFPPLLEERSQFKYPPFYRLVKIIVKHKDRKRTDYIAGKLAQNLKKHFGKMILGPEYPVISRIQNWYAKQIIVKVSRENSFNAARSVIKNELDKIKLLPEYKTVQIYADVDPY